MCACTSWPGVSTICVRNGTCIILHTACVQLQYCCQTIDSVSASTKLSTCARDSCACPEGIGRLQRSPSSWPMALEPCNVLILQSIDKNNQFLVANFQCSTLWIATVTSMTQLTWLVWSCRSLCYITDCSPHLIIFGSLWRHASHLIGPGLWYNNVARVISSGLPDWSWVVVAGVASRGPPNWSWAVVHAARVTSRGSPDSSSAVVHLACVTSRGSPDWP